MRERLCQKKNVIKVSRFQRLFIAIGQPSYVYMNPPNLKFETTQPYFWDLYISLSLSLSFSLTLQLSTLPTFLSLSLYLEPSLFVFRYPKPDRVQSTFQFSVVISACEQKSTHVVDSIDKILYLFQFNYLMNHLLEK